MVTREDLKQIVMLTYLTDPMLDNLAQIVDILKFDRDEILFRENEPAERFYMMVSGNVLLEQRISEKVTACIGSIKHGFSFGWSAMVEDGRYTVDAVCVEPSEIYSFKRDKIQRLIMQDSEMGLRIYQRLLVIIKKRLDYRTEQFRQAIKNHPDLQNLFRS
ncbi:MAG: cyclic nucleotide-binding domain-containing protein [Deltaproteobacteria bacterium]|jgi:CRP-like cAMP-binding protein|nr:cyclic nucleotide-binding domain-containing protein [Deltaproteobacteria bacterium]